MKSSELKKLLNETLAQNKSDYNDFSLIREALKSIDGQSFTTKRLEKALNPIGFNFRIHCGMYYVSREKDDKRYNDHLVGYQTNPVINAEKVADFDSWANAGALSRVNQCEYWLEENNFKELLAVYTKLEKAYKSVKDALNEIEGNKMGSFHVPVHYDLLRIAGIEPSVASEIRRGK